MLLDKLEFDGGSIRMDNNEKKKKEPWRIVVAIISIIFIIGMWVGKIIKGKVKDEKFINSMLGVLIFTLLVLTISTACADWKIDVAGIVICMLIGIIGCFLLFMKFGQYSKMHKKRKKY